MIKILQLTAQQMVVVYDHTRNCSVMFEIPKMRLTTQK